MRNRFLLSLLLAATVVLSPSARADEKAIKIGVASVYRILSELKETKELNSKTEATRADLTAQAKAKQTNLEMMRAALQELKPGSPQYEDRRKELVNKAVEFKSWNEVMNEDMQRQQKQNMKMLYDKIESAVGEIAAKKNLDLVLPDSRQPFPDSVDGVTLDQLKDFIRGRNVLYSHPSLDISSEVTVLLDARYAEKK